MKRKEGESFDEYKERRKTAKKENKQQLKPKSLWPSKAWGTYDKVEDGEV